MSAAAAKYTSRVAGSPNLVTYPEGKYPSEAPIIMETEWKGSMAWKDTLTTAVNTITSAGTCSPHKSIIPGTTTESVVVLLPRSMCRAMLIATIIQRYATENSDGNTPENSPNTLSAAPQAFITPPIEKAAVRKIRVVPSIALKSFSRSVFMANKRITAARVTRVLLIP